MIWQVVGVMWTTTCSLASSFSIVSFWANIIRIFAWNIGMDPRSFSITTTKKTGENLFSPEYQRATPPDSSPQPLGGACLLLITMSPLNFKSIFNPSTMCHKHHWTHLQHQNFFFKPRWWRLAMLEVRRATCALYSVQLLVFLLAPTKKCKQTFFREAACPLCPPWPPCPLCPPWPAWPPCPQCRACPASASLTDWRISSSRILFGSTFGWKNQACDDDVDQELKTLWSW